MEDGGRVMWLALAVSYFLSCRASELWAYTDGNVHPEFCLTRECLTFSRGGVQVEFGNRSTVKAVQIRFVASKCDEKRAGCTITRTRLSNERENSGRIEGGTQLAAQGVSELQIQRAGRWKSRAFMAYIREAGEGAEVASAALRETQ